MNRSAAGSVVDWSTSREGQHQIGAHHSLLPPGCSCAGGAVDALHDCLVAHFPGYVLRHLHAPTTLVQFGMPARLVQHHTVSISRSGRLPYYAVVLGEFFDRLPEDPRELLRRWDLAGALRTHRVVIVAGDGVSGL